MTQSKNKRNIYKRKNNIRNIIKNINNNTKTVISKTKPIFEKSISYVYGTLARSFNMGTKGISKTIKNITYKKNKKYNKTSKKR